MNSLCLCALIGPSLSVLAASATSSDFLGDDWGLESHGFVSFGSLETTGNNWLGQTEHGTTQFWEAAANLIARPIDRLRLGAQVYARDLVEYDNGRATLDWAYADWRFADQIGVQIGRVKIPLGLYNEELDVDASRTPIFQPPSVYALRARDFYISVDGAKIYGFSGIGPLGDLEYAAYGGRKTINTQSGLATFLSQEGLGDSIDGVRIGWEAGGMLHWNTPLHGLGFRISIIDAHDFEVQGHSNAPASTTDSRVGNYYEGILSAELDLESTTFAMEYERLHGRGTVEVQPFGVIEPLTDNSEGFYASCTWHISRTLEAYVGFEGAWANAYVSNRDYLYTEVVALHIQPLAHLSIKGEYRNNYGTYGIYAGDNPQGVSNRWQVFAAKFTVDF